MRTGTNLQGLGDFPTTQGGRCPDGFVKTFRKFSSGPGGTYPEGWYCIDVRPPPSSQPAPPAAPVNVTVSPQVATRVSPQISPSFVQQQQPTGSPVTTGAQQTAPATQTAPTGAPSAPTPPPPSPFPSPSVYVPPVQIPYSVPAPSPVSPVPPMIYAPQTTPQTVPQTAAPTGDIIPPAMPAAATEPAPFPSIPTMPDYSGSSGGSSTDLLAPPQQGNAPQPSAPAPVSKPAFNPMWLGVAVVVGMLAFTGKTKRGSRK